MALSECYQHEAKTSSFTRSLCCWRSLSLTTVMWLNHYRPVVKTPVLVHRGVWWVFPALKKPLVKWSSLPSLTLPVQGTLQRALRNFLKLIPSPSHFQSDVELVFQSESFKKKKNPSGFPCYSGNFPGRWEKCTDIPTATFITNKSQRSRVTRFCPSDHALSWTFLLSLFIYFFPILEQPANDFTPFCLVAKSNTITPLRAASVGSKNKMGSFSC